MSVIEELDALQQQDSSIRELEKKVRDLPLRRRQETDRVDGDPAGYAQKHAKQVGLYAKVLERLTGMRVNEQYIVLLGADAEVRG